MKTIIVQSGQSLIDIAIREYGHIEGVLSLIEDNQFITGYDYELSAGDELLIRELQSELPVAFSTPDIAAFETGSNAKVFNSDKREAAKVALTGSLSDLQETNISNPQEGDTLVYQGGQWVNGRNESGSSIIQKTTVRVTSAQIKAGGYIELLPKPGEGLYYDLTSGFMQLVYNAPVYTNIPYYYRIEIGNIYVFTGFSERIFKSETDDFEKIFPIYYVSSVVEKEGFINKSVSLVFLDTPPRDGNSDLIFTFVYTVNEDEI